MSVRKQAHPYHYHQKGWKKPRRGFSLTLPVIPRVFAAPDKLHKLPWHWSFRTVAVRDMHLYAIPRSYQDLISSVNRQRAVSAMFTFDGIGASTSNQVPKVLGMDGSLIPKLSKRRPSNSYITYQLWRRSQWLTSECFPFCWTPLQSICNIIVIQ